MGEMALVKQAIIYVPNTGTCLKCTYPTSELLYTSKSKPCRARLILCFQGPSCVQGYYTGCVNT